MYMARRIIIVGALSRCTPAVLPFSGNSSVTSPNEVFLGDYERLIQG